MENKNLIYIVGGIAVVGIGYYLYTKRKSATPQQAPVNANVKDADVTAEETEPKATPIGKPKNPMASETITAVGTSIPPASTPPASTPPKATTPKTQLTKNEVEFRLLKKCGVKPLLNIKGSIQKYENCKNSFKDDLRNQGLISFSGDRYSNMSNDFDISFR
jgi:hypothetical protein